MDQILFLRSQDTNKRELIASGTELILTENVKKNIECEFTASNVLPAIDMYVWELNKSLCSQCQ